MEKLSILFMASNNTGLSFNFARLAISLKRLGHNVILVTEPGEEEAGLFEEIKKSNIKFYTLNGLDSLSLRTLDTAKGISQILRENKIDVIHTQGVRQLLTSWFACKILSGGKKVKIVTTIHATLAGSSLERVVLVFEGLLLNLFTDKAIAVANIVKFKLNKFGLLKSKTLMIHNGVDLELIGLYRNDTDIGWFSGKFDKSNYIVLGYFARLEPLKGHEYLLNAMAMLSKIFPNVKLVLAGDGSLAESLKKQSKTLGIDDRVFFLGWVDHKKIVQLFDFIDILVFPSLGELFPFSIIEAMATAKPIVTTNVGGIPEVIFNGKNGVVIPPCSSEELVRGIQTLIKEPVKAKKMGEEGKKFAQTNLSVDVVALRIAECYKQVLVRSKNRITNRKGYV